MKFIPKMLDTGFELDEFTFCLSRSATFRFYALFKNISGHWLQNGPHAAHNRPRIHRTPLPHPDHPIHPQAFASPYNPASQERRSPRALPETDARGAFLRDRLPEELPEFGL